MHRDMPAGMDSLAEIRLFLNSKIDDQNVPCMENFFYNLILRAELMDKGLWRDVAWITVRVRICTQTRTGGHLHSAEICFVCRSLLRHTRPSSFQVSTIRTGMTDSRC